MATPRDEPAQQNEDTLNRRGIPCVPIQFTCKFGSEESKDDDKKETNGGRRPHRNQLATAKFIEESPSMPFEKNKSGGKDGSTTGSRARRGTQKDIAQVRVTGFRENMLGLRQLRSSDSSKAPISVRQVPAPSQIHQNSPRLVRQATATSRLSLKSTSKSPRVRIVPRKPKMRNRQLPLRERRGRPNVLPYSKGEARELRDNLNRIDCELMERMSNKACTMMRERKYSFEDYSPTTSVQMNRVMTGFAQHAASIASVSNRAIAQPMDTRSYASSLSKKSASKIPNGVNNLRL